MENLHWANLLQIQQRIKYNDISSHLTGPWSISLSKERAECFLYNFDSKVNCRSISEALESQKDSNSIASDDDFSVNDGYNIGSSSDNISDNISENESQSRSLGESNSIAASTNTDDPTT